MAETLLPAVQTQERACHDKYLAFSLGEEAYGIDIRFVTEIVGLQKISDIPESPEYVRGIINLRGKIIPASDGMRFVSGF